jgi:serine O-acetyltransferase
MLSTLRTDLRNKALHCYESDGWRSMLKVLVTDGTAAMIYYRLMQWAHRRRLVPLAMIFNKMNAVFCNCIIGRGAEFGPGFVLIHSTGVVINGRVRAGSGVKLYHQVTLGGVGEKSPSLGSNVFIGAGARVIGAVHVGDGARIGANAVVIEDVPAHATAVGVPAKVVRLRSVSDPQLV